MGSAVGTSVAVGGIVGVGTLGRAVGIAEGTPVGGRSRVDVAGSVGTDVGSAIGDCDDGEDVVQLAKYISKKTSNTCARSNAIIMLASAQTLRRLHMGYSVKQYVPC